MNCNHNDFLKIILSVKNLCAFFFADNLAITFTRSQNGDVQVLTCDSPAVNKDRFPKRIRILNEMIQISHRGGLPKQYQHNGVPVFCESNREHWEKVLNKGISPQQRMSVLIPNDIMPHALSRFGQFKEHESITDRDLGALMVGLEDAPFVFCPFDIPSKDIVKELEHVLHKYSQDRFRGTALEHFKEDIVSWHPKSDLARINTMSSNNWRIFVLRVLFVKSVRAGTGIN